MTAITGGTMPIVSSFDEMMVRKATDDVLPAIPSANNILIHTGNIINRGFIYKLSPTVSQEINMTCSKTLRKWLSTVNKHDTKRLNFVDMDYSKITKTGKITEDRKNLKLTVKLFVVNAGPECVKEALNAVGEKLETGYVETLILSLPGIRGCQPNVAAYDLIGPYWEAAENVTNFTFNDAAHHSQCELGVMAANQDKECYDHVVDESKNSKGGDVHISWTIGMSDLNAISLKQLHQHAQEKPSINQIAMDICCSPPQDLVTVCKENDIQLLTHNDPRDILSQEAMYEILSAHLSHDKDLVGWRVAWVLRYSAVLKCRGIIHTKGYIVKLVRNLAMSMGGVGGSR